MVDLVGTCPKGFWLEWLEEGDGAGEPETGEEYAWHTRSDLARSARRGDRFYVVAHGRLRGWAPVIGLDGAVRQSDGEFWYAIIRSGGAVACTIDRPIPGFRGLRRRWWALEEERPFPDWRIP